MADVLPTHPQTSGPAPSQSEMKPGEQGSNVNGKTAKSASDKTKENTVDSAQNAKRMTNGVKEKEKPLAGPKDEKLSGAELKKRKQAEKAARRAQEKEGKLQAETGNVQAPSKLVKQENKSKGSKKTPATPTTALPPSIDHPQHRRTGSIQKTPHPRAQLLADTVSSEPPKHDRRVALFGHLYGKEARWSSIAGATKDVDPAVLAFGLQMSNYVICGSSARCVGLLLSLKRVKSLARVHITRDSLLMLTPFPGHSILHHPSRRCTPSPSDNTSLYPNRLSSILPAPLRQHGQRHSLA